MPRSLYRDTVMVKGPAGAIPLAGAAVEFRDPDTGTLIGYPLYADGTSVAPLALPYVTGGLGELEVWAEQPHRVRITVTKSGLTQAQETVDLEYPPEYGANDEDITNAVLAHEAKPDPHDQYLTEPDGNLLYLPLSYVPPVTDLSNYYTKPQADTKFVDVAGDTMTGNLVLGGGPVSATYRSDGVYFRASGDTRDTFQIHGSNGGELYFGPGGTQNTDTVVGREGVGMLYLQDHLRVGLSLKVGNWSSSKLVGLSPDAGNTMEWRANGFYSTGVDSALRAYIQQIMAVLDPGGPPPPP